MNTSSRRVSLQITHYARGFTATFKCCLQRNYLLFLSLHLCTLMVWMPRFREYRFHHCMTRVIVWLLFHSGIYSPAALLNKRPQPSYLRRKYNEWCKTKRARIRPTEQWSLPWRVNRIACDTVHFYKPGKWYRCSTCRRMGCRTVAFTRHG